MSFFVTILGSGSALPTSKRFATAQVLNVHEQFFLIDCAEGTQIRLRQNKIKFSKINHIFISHLHGDHYYGIFGLLSTFNLLGRTKKLHIYAHKNLKKKINFIFEHEIFNFEIIYYDLNYKLPELIFENKILTVKSIPLKHRVKTCGFVFCEKKKEANIKKESIEKYNLSIKEIVSIKRGSNLIIEDDKIIKYEHLTIPAPIPRKYAFCSDTRYYEKIISEIQNADLLYHEATFTEAEKNLTKQTGHSTALDAAKIAVKANVKKLIIGHFSARYKDTEQHLSEAKEIFENTYVTNDGDVYEI